MDHEIIIGSDGEARHIHDDAVTEMTAAIGDQTIRRASNVEPTDELSEAAFSAASRRLYPHRDTAFMALPQGKWWADLLPVGGPVLGPFDKRQEALDAETEWLRAHNIPTCESCGTDDNSNSGTTND